MKHKVLVDPQEFGSKPDSEAGAISNRIAQYPTEVDIYELADIIQSGRTLVLAGLKADKRRDDSFASSTLIYIDMDDSSSPEEVLAQCKDFPPALMYYSFSQLDYSEPNPIPCVKLGWRFRVVWQFNEPIKIRAVYKSVLSSLISKFGADGSCKDSCRMVYGSKPGSVFHLQDVYVDIPTFKKPEPAKKSKSTRKPTVELTQAQAEYLINFVNKFTAPMMLEGLCDSRYESLKSAVLGSDKGLGLMQLEFMSAELASNIIYSLLDGVFADWDHDIDVKLPPLVNFGSTKIDSFVNQDLLPILTPTRINNVLTQEWVEVAYCGGYASGRAKTRHQANIIRKLLDNCSLETAITSDVPIDTVSSEYWNSKSLKLLEPVWYEAMDFINEDYTESIPYPLTNFNNISPSRVKQWAKLTPDSRFILNNLNKSFLTRL